MTTPGASEDTSRGRHFPGEGPKRGSTDDGVELAVRRERLVANPELAAGPTFGAGLYSPRRRNMQANRRRDSAPELALRSLLHAAGLRYRCDYRLRFGSESVRPDIVFTKRRVAVFVDGCFWHCCPVHASEPRVNSDYWGPKLRKNRERDARNSALLEREGWKVIRIWEHERMTEAKDRIVREVLSRGQQ